VETHLKEGQERAEAVEAHLDTLDGSEKEKVEEFIKEKQFKTNKDGKPLTDAQKRKRYEQIITTINESNCYFRKLKEENSEERKKKRLERLKRKKEKLEEIEKTLESNLDDAEKQKRIKQIEKNGIQKSETEVKETDSKPKGRDWTLSIALPGSILDNAQSPELRTYLAGQIARACAVFQVDEVIIFDESGDFEDDTKGEFTGVKKKGNPNQTLGRILQYLECPQYLRKDLFPHHKDLKYAGLLNPLDTPHHLRQSEFSQYREGIILDRPASQKKGKGSWVNCGIDKDVRVDLNAPAGQRVTVRFDDEQREDGKYLTGKLIMPDQVREETGTYWGYSLRLAKSLGKIFEDVPEHWGEYDMTIGTSERGKNIDNVPFKPFKHALVVFGGVKGLEFSLSQDEELTKSGVENVSDLFDRWLNVMPTGQGSRTIRTEEAILVTLSTMRNKIFKY